MELNSRNLCDDTPMETMIIASMANRNVNLVTEAMTLAPQYLPFSTFGSPIKNAVCLQHEVTLRAILKLLEVKQSESVKEELVSQSTIFGNLTAMLATIRTGRVDMLIELLKCFQTHVSRPGEEVYVSLVSQAMRSREIRSLAAILAAADNSRALHKYRMTSTDLALAYQHDWTEGITSLMVGGNMNLNCT
jgi:hypothetical protein